MNGDTNNQSTSLWVLVAKGWFLGTLTLFMPVILVLLVSLPFVESNASTTEIVFGLLVVPGILALQALMIALVVSIGLKISHYLGI